MRPFTHLAHLSRRFFGSLSRRSPAAADVAWALGHLLQGEAVLWQQMPVQDRRHSIVVARRFAALVGANVVQDNVVQDNVVGGNRAEMAGALLHDVGKGQSELGTLARVVATAIGPRTKRFRHYHDHEALGVEMLRQAGSEHDTLALIAGTGRFSPVLRAADSV